MRFCKLALSCALLVGAFVQAHSQAQIRVNVPFDFTVGNRMLPAGQYQVTTVWTSNTSSWQIFDRQSHSAFVMTNPVSNKMGAEHNISLIFRRFGGQYALVQFWPDSRQGRDVIRPKIAPTVIAQSELVQIAAER